MDRHPAAAVDTLGGDAGVFDTLAHGGQYFFLLADQIDVFLRAPDLPLAERLADVGHLLEIRA